MEKVQKESLERPEPPGVSSARTANLIVVDTDSQ